MTVGWTASPDTNVVGYNVYYGSASGVYTNQTTLGDVTSATLTSLVPGGAYYITVAAYAGGGLESDYANEIVYTVPIVNLPPTLNTLTDASLNEDAGQQTVNLAGISSGSVSEAQTLTVTATSSDTSVIPNPTVTYTSPNTTGTLKFTPVANASGTATITVTVNDGQAFSNLITRTFAVTVNAVNDQPTLSALGNVTISEDAAQQTVNLAGITSGAGNEAQTLTVTATSSDTSVIPNPTVTYTSPNTTGSLTFTPVANASGTATITVTVNDGQAQNNTVTRTFTVTVSAVNDQPTLSTLGNVTINESAGQQVVNLAGITSGAANEIQTLTVTATSSSPSLIPNPTVGYTSPNTTGTLTFTPVANANGTATIIVTVNDNQAQNNTITRTFTVTVNGVNNTPTLNALGNVTISEDAAQQTVNLAGITSGAVNEIQTLAVTATSSDTSVIPNPTVTYTSPNSTGTLKFTPVANANGTATITVTVDDGQAQNNTVTRTFTVTVNAVNDQPTLSTLGNVAISESAGQQTVNLAGITSGAANETQTLTVTATSSTPSLIPNPTVGYTSPGTMGTLMFTPVANANGTATITVTVNDGQAQNNTITRTFTVTVNGVNNAPTLNALGNVTINEDAAQQTVSLAGITSGAVNETQTLTVTATSSDTSVIPNPTVTYTSPNSTGTLKFTPVANANGMATITVTVDDGQAQNNTVTRTFTVTVNAVNDQPTLSTLGNVSISEDAAQQTVNLAGITAGPADEIQTLTVTATSSNPSLIPNPTVGYTSPNTTGTLTFTPVANANGTATITVTVNDGQAQNNTITRTFTVTVSSVNNPPTLNPITGVTLNENDGRQTVSLAGITSGALNEAQTLTVAATSSATSVIPKPTVTYTSPNSTGTLAFTPVTGASGTATITVTVNDGQAQNNTVTRTFVVTVNPANIPPTLNALNDLTVNDNAGQQTVSLAGITSGSVNETQTLTVTATSSNPGVVPAPVVHYTSPNTTGTITFAPAIGSSGSSTVTVMVSDGEDQTTRSFTVTVKDHNNSAPTISAISNQTAIAFATIAPIAFTIGDAETPASDLILTATSSVPSLLPVSGIVFSGNDANRAVTLNPTPGMSGGVDITITVDDGSDTTSTSFHLDIQAVSASGQQLGVIVSGSGAASAVVATGNASIKSSLMKQYTLTAMPDAGWYFAGWSGSVSSTANPLSLSFIPGMTVVANFLPDPFFPAAGDYNGLFFEADQVRVCSAGSLHLTIGSRGTYSGSLVLAAGSYPVSGQLGEDFRGTNMIARSGKTALVVTFQIGQNSQADQINGIVTDGSWTANFAGDRAVYSAATNPAPCQGLYTFIVPGSDSGNPSLPVGNGYGTILVDSNGLASISGTLADGTAIAQLVPVSKYGQCPLYLPLYSGNGCLVSWLTFSNQTDTDITGDLSWVKLSTPGSANYSQGFTNETTIAGSSYVTPTPPDVLSTTNVSLFLDNADLANSITNVLTFNASSQILNWSANALTFNLKINTGIFTGSVIDPATGLAHAFGGAILQKSDLGYGFFLSGGLSGRVSLLTTGIVPVIGSPAAAGTMTMGVIQLVAPVAAPVVPHVPTIILRGGRLAL